MLTLDKLDRRILRELDQNSRQSYAALERKLNARQETIRYRLRSLMESGVILTFLTVIDAGKLGNSYYKVFVKLHNANEMRVDEIIAHLVASESVNWVARVDGLYDIGFTIRVRQLRELSNFVDDIKERYRESIHRIVFAINIEVEFLVRDYLTNSKRRTKAAGYTTPEAVVKVDDTDVAILRAIANDTRISASELAEVVSISPLTATERLKKLEQSGIITRYRFVLNNAVIGQINYYILVYLQYVSEDKRNEFLSFCRSHPRIIYLIKALGEWDYELNIEVETLAQYRDLMTELTSRFSDIVRDYYAMPVSNVYKLTIAP